jgi:paraquat-inducible protein B
VDRGSVVLFRGLPVGEVLETRLGKAGDRVLVKIHVDAPYRHLVRDNSRFWIAGGLGLDFSLFGSSTLKATSLESLVRGAVAFATPDSPGKAVREGHRFALADKPSDAWLKWQPAFGDKVPPLVQPEPPAEPKSSPEPVDPLSRFGAGL